MGEKSKLRCQNDTVRIFLCRQQSNDNAKVALASSNTELENSELNSARNNIFLFKITKLFSNLTILDERRASCRTQAIQF